MFLKSMSKQFILEIVSLLNPLHIYENEIVYSLFDKPDKIFFVEKGSFKLLIDIQDYTAYKINNKE
jgi:hypothetical protein